jgi:hypothetical protein
MTLGVILMTREESVCKRITVITTVSKSSGISEILKAETGDHYIIGSDAVQIGRIWAFFEEPSLFIYYENGSRRFFLEVNKYVQITRLQIK